MKSFFKVTALACFLAISLAQALATPRQTNDGKYALDVILVSPKDECSAQSKKRNWIAGKEKYNVGELVCPAAESVVEQVFEKHTNVETIPEKGSAPGKVVLTFRFVDLEVTTTVTAFGTRKMVMLIEWSATDETGKVFWIQTVQGNAQEKAGNVFTAGKHKKKMLESIKKDITEKSVRAMRESPEFQKLVQKAQ